MMVLPFLKTISWKLLGIINSVHLHVCVPLCSNVAVVKSQKVQSDTSKLNISYPSLIPSCPFKFFLILNGHHLFSFTFHSCCFKILFSLVFLGSFTDQEIIIVKIKQTLDSVHNNWTFRLNWMNLLFNCLYYQYFRHLYADVMNHLCSSPHWKVYFDMTTSAAITNCECFLCLVKHAILLFAWNRPTIRHLILTIRKSKLTQQQMLLS